MSCVENLTISGISLTTPNASTPAWMCGDLSPLADGPDVRGEDVILPGVNGVIALRRRIAVSKRSVEMVIFGAFDRFGTPQSDRRIGLQRNTQYLIDNLILPVGGDGTRAAVLTMADGTSRYADVHVLSPLQLAAATGDTRRAVLTISIPGGYFQP